MSISVWVRDFVTVDEDGFQTACETLGLNQSLEGALAGFVEDSLYSEREDNLAWIEDKGYWYWYPDPERDYIFFALREVEVMP